MALRTALQRAAAHSSADRGLLRLVAPPHAAFNEAPLSVARTPTGYASTFDWSLPSEFDGATAYYVDVANGSDSNAGTSPAAPLKGIKTAIHKPDSGIIYIRPTGVYHRASGDGLQNLLADVTWPNRPLALIGWGGVVDIWNTNPGQAYSWASQGSGVYSATVSNVYGVLDASQADTVVPTLPFPLTPRADLATLQAAAEGFFISGSTVYVKRTGGGAVNDQNIHMLRIQTMTQPGGPVLYLQNLRWIGRGNGFQHISFAYQPTGKCIVDNCTFAFTDPNGQNNGFAVDNIGLVAVRGSQSHYCTKDNFNYHADTDQFAGRRPVVLEENCSAKVNSWRRPAAEADGSNQATTIHDGMIGVRINGTYGPTYGGACVEEAGVDRGAGKCYSWLVGCTLDATGSPGPNKNWPVYVGAATDMWLLDCAMTGGQGPFRGTGTPGLEGYVWARGGAWSGTPGLNAAAY